MSAAIVTAAFENGRETRQVSIHIGEWIDERISNARLCREVNDIWKAVLLEQCRDPFAIGEVKFDKLKSIGFREFRTAGFLQRRIVVGIHIIEADNIAAIAQETLCDVETDEACGSGHEDWTVSHCARPTLVFSPLEAPQFDPLGLLIAVELCLDVEDNALTVL